MEHKIGLCADDVVLLLTNPSRSLKAADSALQEFGRVSYYEINADKSLILGAHTFPSQQALLLALASGSLLKIMPFSTIITNHDLPACQRNCRHIS